MTMMVRKIVLMVKLLWVSSTVKVLGHAEVTYCCYV